MKSSTFVRTLTVIVGGQVPNYAVNASVLASRRLRGKRRASRPARYRGR